MGVFLSGGIDSALTTYYLDKPRTYSLGFDARDRSELDAARSVATHLHTVHTEMMAQAADFEQALDAMPGLFDEPFGDSAAWSNYLIAQFARREVTVALSGEGGDEVFCGYPRYWSRVGARSNPLNRSLARPSAAADAPRLLDAASRLRRPARLCGRARRHDGGADRRAAGDPWRECGYDYLWFYRQFWREDLSPLVQLRWLDLNTDLAEGLLTKVDRTSMAHSLEVRPPLLDHRLVEFMLSVDPALLVDERRRRGKLLVRRLMEPRLPAGHLDRPKSGFGLPVHRWLKRHPQLLQEAVDAAHGARRAADARWARNSAGPGRCWCSTAGSPPLTESNPRMLFVPVSGPYGMGEYARSSAIARAVRQRWPSARDPLRAEPRGAVCRATRRSR